MTVRRVNWNREIITDVNPALKRFERWLTEHGYRNACINTYLRPIERFLKETDNDNPTREDAMLWHGDLAESKLARSTVNIWGAALKAFYKSLGMELTLPYMKVSNKIPYFFSEEEVLAIFSSCTNLKHYTMLNLMFYCMLRAGGSDQSRRRRYRFEDYDFADSRWQVREVCHIARYHKVVYRF